MAAAGSSGICSSLDCLFNLHLRGSVVPQASKMAHVTPVHKSGANTDISNYRPISVLPVIVKVLEKIVHERLYKYFQAKSIPNQCQFGFRPNHTTQDVLVSTTEDWRRAIGRGKLVGAAMVDLSKAFDLVQHDILHAEEVGEIWSTGR